MDVARPSRPPGFDMTYRPAERVFLPPWRVRLPSLVYLVVALAVLALVAYAEASPSNSILYVEVVEKSSRRIITARTFAILLSVSAIAAVLRAGMRGVRVRGDGVEFRDVVSLIIPKLRRFRWAQIDQIVLDRSDSIALELWDGTRAYLPAVSDRSALSAALEKVAAARAIPVRGGTGLFELPEPDELSETTSP